MQLEAGIRYGRWTTQPDLTDKKNHTVCKCDCGTIRPVYNSLLTGKRTRSKSCGCTRKTHGLSSHPFYRHWRDMKRRCDRNEPGYENISYDLRWKDPVVFIADAMKFRTPYRKGLTLDRTNPRINYGSANCDWQTKKQQAANRGSSQFLHSRFGTYTTQDWFRILESLRASKKRGTLKNFKTSLQYVGGEIDALLLTTRKTDEQIQEHIRNYHRMAEIDALRQSGLTDEQIAEHLAGTAHCADEQNNLVPA